MPSEDIFPLEKIIDFVEIKVPLPLSRYTATQRTDRKSEHFLSAASTLYLSTEIIVYGIVYKIPKEIYFSKERYDYIIENNPEIEPFVRLENDGDIIFKFPVIWSKIATDLLVIHHKYIKFTKDILSYFTSKRDNEDIQNKYVDLCNLFSEYMKIHENKELSDSTIDEIFTAYKLIL